MTHNNSSSLPYLLQFEQKPDYLLAKVTGEKDSFEISVSFWTEIALEVDLRNPKKLLVWEDFKNVVNPHDMFKLVDELNKVTEFQNLHIAFVDEQFEQLERNKHAEIMASNRGHSIRVFSDLKEAETWLLGI